MLLAEELTLRENRRIKIALMMARLSTIKDARRLRLLLPALARQNRIMALAELEFINRSEVVHFLGPPGTGKSHLSLALERLMWAKWNFNPVVRHATARTERGRNR